MNNEPVAWMRKDGTLKFQEGMYFEVGQAFYTHPVKELTDAEILELAIEAWGSGHEVFWFDDDGITLFARAILRKAQEK